MECAANDLLDVAGDSCFLDQLSGALEEAHGDNRCSIDAAALLNNRLGATTAAAARRASVDAVRAAQHVAQLSGMDIPMLEDLLPLEDLHDPFLEGLAAAAGQHEPQPHMQPHHVWQAQPQHPHVLAAGMHHRDPSDTSPAFTHFSPTASGFFGIPAYAEPDSPAAALLNNGAAAAALTPEPMALPASMAQALAQHSAPGAALLLPGMLPAGLQHAQLVQPMQLQGLAAVFGAQQNAFAASQAAHVAAAGQGLPPAIAVAQQRAVEATLLQQLLQQMQQQAQRQAQQLVQQQAQQQQAQQLAQQQAQQQQAQQEAQQAQMQQQAQQQAQQQMQHQHQQAHQQAHQQHQQGVNAAPLLPQPTVSAQQLFPHQQQAAQADKAASCELPGATGTSHMSNGSNGSAAAMLQHSPFEGSAGAGAGAAFAAAALQQRYSDDSSGGEALEEDDLEDAPSGMPSPDGGSTPAGSGSIFTAGADGTAGAAAAAALAKRGGRPREKKSYDALIDPNLPLEEIRRLRRMLSNRESARRSRRRRQSQVSTLEDEMEQLRMDKQWLQSKLQQSSSLAEQLSGEKQQLLAELERLRCQLAQVSTSAAPATSALPATSAPAAATAPATAAVPVLIVPPAAPTVGVALQQVPAAGLAGGQGGEASSGGRLPHFIEQAQRLANKLNQQRPQA